MSLFRKSNTGEIKSIKLSPIKTLEELKHLKGRLMIIVVAIVVATNIPSKSSC